MKLKAQLFAVMFLTVLISGCTTSSAESAAGSNSANTLAASGTDLVKGYRQWTRVNPVPAVFLSRIATQCFGVTPKLREMDAGDPHRDKFITVYVNELGTKAMMREKDPHFPQGSVIVKEKLPGKESTSPELLTVMIKREAGFNPENGDWEYMSLNGSGTEVQVRGRLEKCQACHALVKGTDYVHRNYLPREVWEKLK
jgi:hypothetical protein